MQALNAEVVFGGRSYAEVAADFLVENGLTAHREGDRRRWHALLTNTLQHLKLTGIALSAAVVLGVGLSLAVFRSKVISRGVTYACGLLQTVPSIALLALMIPLFGIGDSRRRVPAKPIRQGGERIREHGDCVSRVRF